MKALIGLGNPESRYARNRHNIGFLIVDEIARAVGAALEDVSQYSRFCRISLCGADTLLVKPQTYMNHSGLAVRELLERWDMMAADLLVVCDDLNLPLGKIRLRAGGSAGGHNGMKSIISEIGTDQFPRLRFGIGPACGVNVADFVLSDFAAVELLVVERAVERSVKAIRSLWENGIAKTMSLFNQEPEIGKSIANVECGMSNADRHS
ncbi:MAG TPA: aminoacyl-tRNA hydrolase [Acidobacteriota bacterium]|nr:aminoacyl-tRNA hydrolase [Acidobacteriota bacterium]